MNPVNVCFFWGEVDGVLDFCADRAEERRADEVRDDAMLVAEVVVRHLPERWWEEEAWGLRGGLGVSGLIGIQCARIEKTLTKVFRCASRPSTFFR